ncbi:helix-turn-helix domain-containing protein [Candidatus Uhrbacteria bacterium]|nr:helix-turn-helix domain-containing protein [Candidatus Uhrbacteria bacterium]
MAFFMRQLSSSTIGGALKSLRKRQGISLDTIAKTTHIQRKYVEAFERDEYTALPDPLYARHFLRVIVECLHGDAEYFLARFDEECGTCPAIVDELRTPRQRISKQLLSHWRSIAGRVHVSLSASLRSCSSHTLGAKSIHSFPRPHFSLTHQIPTYKRPPPHSSSPAKRIPASKSPSMTRQSFRTRRVGSLRNSHSSAV